MKLKNYFCLLIILTQGINIFADTKTIIKDSNSKSIEATFNENGIIEKLNGSISNYSVEDLDITIDNNTIKISKNSSSDGCYDIEIQKYENFIIVTKIFTANKVFKPRNNLTYKILFDKNDAYYIKDDFITIRKSDITSQVSDSSDSYLPMLKYQNNTCIQYFGKTITKESTGSRKYEYSSDKKNIECYEIKPGDVWKKYMSATVSDFITHDIAVNVINYLILYNYDYQLGVMLFPILFNLDEENSNYIELEITADSYLTEGATKYIPDNLRDTNLGTPWVEGKSGDGIGSKIKLHAKENISALVISNGFDSVNKNLFKNNNRVRRIYITDMNNIKNKFDVELPDTTEPYEIKLPFNTNYLQLEIVSVYKGAKYEDTCLNYILAK